MPPASAAACACTRTRAGMGACRCATWRVAPVDELPGLEVGVVEHNEAVEQPRLAQARAALHVRPQLPRRSTAQHRPHDPTARTAPRVTPGGRVHRPLHGAGMREGHRHAREACHARETALLARDGLRPRPRLRTCSTASCSTLALSSCLNVSTVLTTCSCRAAPHTSSSQARARAPKAVL